MNFWRTYLYLTWTKEKTILLGWHEMLNLVESMQLFRRHIRYGGVSTSHIFSIKYWIFGSSIYQKSSHHASLYLGNMLFSFSYAFHIFFFSWETKLTGHLFNSFNPNCIIFSSFTTVLPSHPFFILLTTLSTTIFMFNAFLFKKSNLFFCTSFAATFFLALVIYYFLVSWFSFYQNNNAFKYIFFNNSYEFISKYQYLHSKLFTIIYQLYLIIQLY